MTHEDMIIARVADIDEDSARELLAQVFLEVSRVGSAADEEKAFNAIKMIYRRAVVLQGVSDLKR